LCGEIHRLHVHGYPHRCYRDRESGENRHILVVAIYCAQAHAAGRPYTKRLLPDFLIPRCVIRLDHLAQAAGEVHRAKDVENTCRILGCIDARTARSHLKRLEQAVAAVAVGLAKRRAMAPELGELSHTSPHSLPLARLQVLYRSERDAALRAGAGAVPISLRQMLQAVLWKPPGEKPSTCAYPSPRAP